MSRLARPFLTLALLGAQVGLYASAVFAAIVIYAAYGQQRVYPFAETFLHFALVVAAASLPPLILDRAARRSRRRYRETESRWGSALLGVALSICVVGALFCLPLLAPLLAEARALWQLGSGGGDAWPAIMPISATIVFLSFAYFQITVTLVSATHLAGWWADRALLEREASARRLSPSPAADREAEQASATDTRIVSATAQSGPWGQPARSATMELSDPAPDTAGADPHAPTGATSEARSRGPDRPE